MMSKAFRRDGAPGAQFSRLKLYLCNLLFLQVISKEIVVS